VLVGDPAFMETTASPDAANFEPHSQQFRRSGRGYCLLAGMFCVPVLGAPAAHTGLWELSRMQSFESAG
jgi:hypothetical protein